MARYADAPDELEAHLATRTPAWAAAITGLSEQEIVDFARLYGRTKRSYIRIGFGFSRSRNGSANVHAVTCIPTVTGGWQYKGGGAFYNNSDVYPWDRTLIEALAMLDASIRVLDMSRLGPLLCRHRRDLADCPPVQPPYPPNKHPPQ